MDNKLNNVQAVLTRFRDFVISESKKNLNKGGTHGSHNKTSSLKNFSSNGMWMPILSIKLFDMINTWMRRRRVHALILSMICLNLRLFGNMLKLCLAVLLRMLDWPIKWYSTDPPAPSRIWESLINSLLPGLLPKSQGKSKVQFCSISHVSPLSLPVSVFSLSPVIVFFFMMYTVIYCSPFLTIQAVSKKE